MRVAMHCGGTVRAEQRHSLDVRAMLAQEHIGQPAFHLVAEKQVEEDVPMVHAADRTIGVYLHTQAREAFETHGRERLRGHSVLLCRA